MIENARIEPGESGSIMQVSEGRLGYQLRTEHIREVLRWLASHSAAYSAIAERIDRHSYEHTSTGDMVAARRATAATVTIEELMRCIARPIPAHRWNEAADAAQNVIDRYL